MKVNVLGVEYDCVYSNEAGKPSLVGCAGYCDETIRECVVDLLEVKLPNDKKDLDVQKRKVMRHEIIHAFLFESGLAECSWATNEEMVDWIARQFPKLATAFKEVGCDV